ncbi:MAG TPA: aerial mycelium formation protein [Actinomycetota bacterium]
MSDAPMAGGKRRIDRILADDFVRDLESLETDDLRARRDLSKAEREYLSFLRRLLQGRRDILRDELRRREEGGEAGPLVERITAVLGEGPRGRSRGEAVSVPLPEEEATLARRRIERLLSDASLSDLEGLSDDDLRETIERVEREERTVSEARGRVMGVHDRLQGEMKRRLRAQLKGLRA